TRISPSSCLLAPPPVQLRGHAPPPVQLRGHAPPPVQLRGHAPPHQVPSQTDIQAPGHPPPQAFHTDIKFPVTHLHEHRAKLVFMSHAMFLSDCPFGPSLGARDTFPPEGDLRWESPLQESLMERGFYFFFFFFCFVPWLSGTALASRCGRGAFESLEIDGILICWEWQPVRQRRRCSEYRDTRRHRSRPEQGGFRLGIESSQAHRPKRTERTATSTSASQDPPLEDSREQVLFRSVTVREFAMSCDLETDGGRSLSLWPTLLSLFGYFRRFHYRAGALRRTRKGHGASINERLLRVLNSGTLLAGSDLPPPPSSSRARVSITSGKTPADALSCPRAASIQILGSADENLPRAERLERPASPRSTRLAGGVTLGAGGSWVGGGCGGGDTSTEGQRGSCSSYLNGNSPSAPSVIPIRYLRSVTGYAENKR
ncbi:hypothetical protein C7M84_011834, partial [Penaeus vannamei]